MKARFFFLAICIVLMASCYPYQIVRIEARPRVHEVVEYDYSVPLLPYYGYGGNYYYQHSYGYGYYGGGYRSYGHTNRSYQYKGNSSHNQNKSSNYGYKGNSNNQSRQQPAPQRNNSGSNSGGRRK